MKKFTWSVVLFLGSAALWGIQGEETKAYSGHNGIYLIAGYGDLVETEDWRWLETSPSPLVDTLKARQLFKLGFSFKYQLFHQVKSGLHLAYTQTGFWNLLGESSPFVETNYNPELFWRFQTRDNFARDVDLGFLNHLQLGVDHLSNGVAGPDSRGFDRLYGEVGLGYGDLLRAEVTTRYFIYLYQILDWSWYRPDTTDMHLYRSNLAFSFRLFTPGEGIFFLPRELLVKGGPGGGFHGFDWSKGFVSFHLTFGSLFGGLSPYAEAFWGTGESLLNYSASGLSFRLGIRAY